MVKEPIEALYFNWLCAKVLEMGSPVYFDLMRILYKTEFVWVIPGDRNRAEDGIELRTYFLREAFLKDDPLWHSEPCSVLEVLLAFAAKASFQTEIPTRDWFWRFMTNLGLDEYRLVAQDDVFEIEEILDTFIWRTYHPSGHGGLFPMNAPMRDQTRLEIWYQFCEYVEDQRLI